MRYPGKLMRKLTAVGDVYEHALLLTLQNKMADGAKGSGAREGPHVVIEPHQGLLREFSSLSFSTFSFRHLTAQRKRRGARCHQIRTRRPTGRRGAARARGLESVVTVNWFITH